MRPHGSGPTIHDARGIVVFRKGKWGWIRDEQSPDADPVFFHIADLVLGEPKDLVVGSRVLFDLEINEYVKSHGQTVKQTDKRFRLRARRIAPEEK